MRILVVNLIPYTSETKYINRADSIKDTMIYDLCLAFYNNGHEVTLIAAEPFQPNRDEAYPFRVIWGKCALPGVFMPHRFPVTAEVWRYIRNNFDKIDYIITSEVFSAASLTAYFLAPHKTVIWHELAKHNALLKKIPSKIWYSFVARHLMKKARVVARSNEAKHFIEQYCANVSDTVIDHGVNLEKFTVSAVKENCFVVCSQLIERKRIDGIIKCFAAYLNKYDPNAVLYIVGDGNQKEKLMQLSQELGVADRIVFTGRLRHEEMMPILSRAWALLVNTEKDNSMISIVEAIAVGTPVVTTDVPLNAEYIKKSQLGIAKKEWDVDDLRTVVEENERYAGNCIAYRRLLSTDYRVKQFLQIKENK